VAEVRGLLSRIRLTDTPFREDLPVSDLHWIIADRQESVTVESVAEGVMVYDNPVGVLTNNPPFPQQLFRLNDFMHLSPRGPENRFSDKLDLRPYSRGMGAMGLPGDLSSPSRFVRATFVKMNSVSGDTETESVGQFFHILGSVDQARGCCAVGEREYEITIYTSCCNADRGIYYYTTYENPAITAVDMMREDLDGANLVPYPMLTQTRILWQNGN
jgi:choloylglycine hydrolase